MPYTENSLNENDTQNFSLLHPLASWINSFAFSLLWYLFLNGGTSFTWLQEFLLDKVDPSSTFPAAFAILFGVRLFSAICKSGSTDQNNERASRLMKVTTLIPATFWPAELVLSLLSFNNNNIEDSNAFFFAFLITFAIHAAIWAIVFRHHEGTSLPKWSK